MRPRVRDIRYCYICKDSTSHVRGGEFTDWQCDSKMCQERRIRALRTQQGNTDGDQSPTTQPTQAPN